MLSNRYIIMAGVSCFSVGLPHTVHAELKLTIYPSGYVAAIDDPLEAQKQVDSSAGNASLVDNKEWEGQRATHIKDMTEYIPSVITRPRNGAESSRLSIRGSGLANMFQGSGLLVLQDGIPINTADGGFEFPVIDPWLTDYVEVFPGANALEYGASTFGGAMNFISPNGMTAGGYQFRGEGGSFETLHGQASAGKEWKTGDIFAAVNGFSQNGFRQQNEQNTSRLSTNYGWKPNDHFTNRIYINHTHSNAEIPGTLSRAEIRLNPRLANPANIAGNYQRNLDITRIANKASWAENQQRVDSMVFYTYRTLDNPVTTYEYQHNNDMGLSAKYSYTEDKTLWMMGMNHYYGTANETRYQNTQGIPGAPILTRTLYAGTTEIYSQLQQQLVKKLYGIASIQGSYAMRDIHQAFPEVVEQNKDYNGISPRIGLRYDIARNKQIFANISRSFEPPSWAELSGGNDPGFNQLKAQRATTFELGTRYRFYNLNWQVAYYHGWLKGEFVNYRFPDGSTNTINAHRTKRDGIELGMNGNIAKHVWEKNDALAIHTVYNFSHFTLDNDPLYGNNKLPGVPEHDLRAELMYHHASGFSIGPNIELSPKASPVDLANSFYTKPYAVYGLRGVWENADKRFNMYIEGNNLFNRHYITTNNVIPDAEGEDGRYFYPGEGRSFYAGFRVSL